MNESARGTFFKKQVSTTAPLKFLSCNAVIVTLSGFDLQLLKQQEWKWIHLYVKSSSVCMCSVSVSWSYLYSLLNQTSAAPQHHPSSALSERRHSLRLLFVCLWTTALTSFHIMWFIGSRRSNLRNNRSLLAASERSPFPPWRSIKASDFISRPLS